MMHMRTTAVGFLLLLLLSGCAVDPVPEVAYYRMPEPAPSVPVQAPALAMPIVVDTFLADGLHGEQAVLYSTSPTGNVRAYHYQLWNDPPVRLLQRRLIKHLRQERVSDLVTDRLGSAVPALRVTGLIERFERVKHDEGWQADIRIELRVDAARDRPPLLLKVYEARVSAESDSMNAAVRAFAQGVDRIFSEFRTDLEALQP